MRLGWGVFLLLPMFAWAQPVPQSPQENTALLAEDVLAPLPETEQKRARDVWVQLRCVVCAGQSIAQSDAPLAADLRLQVAQHVAAGTTTEAIMHDIALRYGDAVLMAPPLNPRTAFLWAAPLLFLVVGASLCYTSARRRHRG